MTTTKRNNILQAALQLFVEHGFKGTSTSQIAKTAGVGTGTLFHHFKTKEELIRALYLEVKFALAEELEAALPEQGSHQEKLYAIWSAFVDWAVAHKAEYRFFRHCEATPYISQEIRQQAEARFAFIFVLFGEICAARKEQNISQELLLDLFAGMMQGFIQYLLKHPEIQADQDIRKNAFALCWQAIS